MRRRPERTIGVSVSPGFAAPGAVAGVRKVHRARSRLSTPRPNTMQLKTILNRVAKQPGFVFDTIQLVVAGSSLSLLVHVREHGRSRARCSCCMRKRPGYDRLPERRFEFVPLVE